MRNIFNFEGGEYLTTMGASWFVSYAYYLHIDRNHKNWQRVDTYINRSNVFRLTNSYHKFWLEKVLEMSELNLSKNKLGLNGFLVKKMAKELLNNLV